MLNRSVCLVFVRENGEEVLRQCGEGGLVLILYRSRGQNDIVVSKISALWLVLLILLPFTAPFPTCDLADLLGPSATNQGVPLPPVSPAASLAAPELSLLVPPLQTVAGHMSQVALSGLNTPFFTVRSSLVILVPSVGSDDGAGTERVPPATLRL